MKICLFQITLVFIFCTQQLLGQLEPIDVADLTLKVGGMKTETLYYGFAQGDEIIFSFEELKGKPIKEVKITELPSNSKFMDFKAVYIPEKKIKVNKKSIYKFSFKNGAMSGRICKVTIKRIPKSEDLISFNTDWEWKTHYDTTYIAYTEDSIVGYDTTYYNVIKQKLIRDEYVLEDIMINHQVKVHSRYYNCDLLLTNVGQYNEELVQVNLPREVNTKYEKIDNIYWFYGIGIDQTVKINADKKRSDVLNGAAAISGKLPGYGTAVSVGFSVLEKLTTDNSDLSIYTGIFTSYDNALLFKNDNPQAKAIRWDNIVSTGTTKIEQPASGTIYFGFENENGSSAVTGGTEAVTVCLSVTMWRRHREYEDYTEKKQKITARKVTLNKERMVVKTRQVMVNSE